MHQPLDGATVSRHVDQQWSRHLVPVPRPVPVILVIPLELTGVDIESHDRVRVEVVARPLVADPGPRVAGAPVGEV